MHFEDLSPYCYSEQPHRWRPNKNVLNIGWLDAAHPFQNGVVPERLLKRIFTLCCRQVNPMMGFHSSPFQEPTGILGHRVECEGKEILLGSAEIRVFGKDGKRYAAPNLIYHYIKDCGYLPPQEFLDAVEWMDVEDWVNPQPMTARTKCTRKWQHAGQTIDDFMDDLIGDLNEFSSANISAHTEFAEACSAVGRTLSRLCPRERNTPELVSLEVVVQTLPLSKYSKDQMYELLSDFDRVRELAGSKRGEEDPEIWDLKREIKHMILEEVMYMISSRLEDVRKVLKRSARRKD
jgi:hypothetical protein